MTPLRFQPAWWAVCGVVIGAGFLGTLGLWQMQRAQAKQLLLDQVAASAQAPAQELGAQMPAVDRITHVRVSGRYDVSRQLLLDNQSHQQRPGYQVWTPMRLADGGLVLVNRGWIPLTNRAELPSLSAPEGVQDIAGYWQPLPQAGLHLAAGPCTRALKFPQIVNYPKAEDLACILGEPVRAGELLLEAGMPAGYERSWTFDNGFPPSRHYGYAVQWFALAATLIILFIKLNLKRANKEHE